MLEVSAAAAVHRDRGPFVVEHSGLGSSRIHHGLNRQHHAFAQTRATPAGAEIGHLRLFVQLGSDAVPDKLTHYAEAVGLDVLLHSSANITHRIPNARL